MDASSRRIVAPVAWRRPGTEENLGASDNMNHKNYRTMKINALRAAVAGRRVRDAAAEPRTDSARRTGNQSR